MSKDINRILTFWFEHINPAQMASHRDEWWQKNDAFDQQIRDEFEEVYLKAAKGDLEHWQTTPMGAVALVLLLDQFPRNMYRDSAKAFATDPMARKVTRYALKMGFHQLLPMGPQVFLYLPLEHSEQQVDQDASVKLFEMLGDENYTTFALRHQMVIERFGRFPHRNKILRRDSTDEEIEFLKTPNSRF
jgi:uncharacterized protein (DUF924 family)